MSLDIAARPSSPVRPHSSPLAPHASPAPVTGWRSVLKETLLVGSSTLLCHALGAVTSLLLRGLLDPAQMGIWQGLKTFLSYGNYSNLGISKGATQELSQAMGRGDAHTARRGLDLAHTVNTLTSFAYAAALAAAGAWIAWRQQGEWSTAWGLGLAVMGLLAIVQRHVTFKVTILRARQKFAATTRLQALEAVTTLTASALATWLWGLTGLYVATACVLLTSLAFLWRAGADPLAWAWDLREIRRLVGIGGPILLAGVASSLFRSLDKLMILGYLDDREYQLGCYSLALMVGTQLYGLANMLSTVMGPRYSELLGRRQSRREVAQLAARATEIQASLVALPAWLAIVVAAPVLGWLLPEYRAGLEPLLWTIPAVLAVGLALPASPYLLAINRGFVVVAALAASTAAAAAGIHVALSYAGGLTGVATAMLGANLMYLALLAGLSLWPELSHTGRWRYAATLTLTLGTTFLLTLTVPLVPLDDLSGLAITCLRAIGVLLIWTLAARLGWRYGGWSQAWRTKGAA